MKIQNRCAPFLPEWESEKRKAVYLFASLSEKAQNAFDAFQEIVLSRQITWRNRAVTIASINPLHACLEQEDGRQSIIGVKAFSLDIQELPIRSAFERYLSILMPELIARREDNATYASFLVAQLQMVWQAPQSRRDFLHTMPYRDYLQTPEWKERRKQAMKQAGYRCQLCNAHGVRLNTHHRTYERRGYEDATDLITLCEECHSIFHENGKLAPIESGVSA